MIPGQWEPRRSNPVTPPPASVPAILTREAKTPIAKRREQATWLEVSICVAALLATMLFAMWAARFERRVTMQFDPQVSPATAGHYERQDGNGFPICT